MTDLVTRLREAADALEETAAYKGGNSLAEAWKERDALKAKLAEAEKRCDLWVDRAHSEYNRAEALLERVKRLEAVAEAAHAKRGSGPHAIDVSTGFHAWDCAWCKASKQLDEALAALEETP